MLYLSLLQSWQVSTGVGILFAVVIFILGNPMYEAATDAVGNAHIHVYKVVHILLTGQRVCGGCMHTMLHP